MGIDLASQPVGIWFLKITKTYLGTIDQPRTRWDISRTWTSTSSLRWYLSLHISGRALSRHKLILFRYDIVIPGRRCSKTPNWYALQGILVDIKNAYFPRYLFWWQTDDIICRLLTSPPQNKNDTKGCPFGTGNICMCFVFSIITFKTIYYRRSHFSISYYQRWSFCSVTEAPTLWCRLSLRIYFVCSSLGVGW